jgi:hypothetical protein
MRRLLAARLPLRGNDAADAAAICEAVVRPGMRFVPVKAVERQAATMLHRTRTLLLRQGTQPINALRGHPAESGRLASRGARDIRELADLVRGTGSKALQDAAHAMLVPILEQIQEARVRIAQVEPALEAWAKNSARRRGYGAEPSTRERFRAEGAKTVEIVWMQGMAAFAERYAHGPTRVQFENKDPRGFAEFKRALAGHDATGAANTQLGVQREQPSLYDQTDKMRALRVPRWC